MTRITDALEATLASLDALHKPILERRVRQFDELRSFVAGLDVVSSPIDESEPAGPEISARPPTARRPAHEQPAFEEPEPEYRRLERERLTREALRERGAW